MKKLTTHKYFKIIEGDRTKLETLRYVSEFEKNFQVEKDILLIFKELQIFSNHEAFKHPSTVTVLFHILCHY